MPACILSVFNPCSIRGRISACAAIVPDLSLITTNRAPLGVVVVRYPVQILGGVERAVSIKHGLNTDRVGSVIMRCGAVERDSFR